MGKKGSFKKVNLFAGLIFRDRDIIPKITGDLTKEFSEEDLVSDIFTFDFTDYDYSEMGSPLFKLFVSFKELISPEILPEIKIITNKLEDHYSSNKKRIVNIDPGYISDSNVIIATTKNHYHRIPLGKGIYAHMEYIFKKRTLHTLEWTYPDFRSENYKSFFSELFLVYGRKSKNNN